MIKQPWILGVSFILLLVLGYFVVDRISFLRSAERTTGTVDRVNARDTTCGSRRSRHSCTKFNADIKYPVNGTIYMINIGAGDARGYGQPLSRANYYVTQPVEVVYDPASPVTAYQDSFMGVWGTPFMIFIFQIVSFFTSFTEPRNRKW